MVIYNFLEGVKELFVQKSKKIISSILSCCMLLSVTQIFLIAEGLKDSNETIGSSVVSDDIDCLSKLSTDTADKQLIMGDSSDNVYGEGLKQYPNRQIDGQTKAFIVIPGISGSAIHYIGGNKKGYGNKFGSVIWIQATLSGMSKLVAALKGPFKFNNEGKANSEDIGVPDYCDTKEWRELQGGKALMDTDKFGTYMLGTAGVYQSLLQKVSEIKGYNDWDVRFFPYDWRYSSADTAKKLDAFIRSGGMTCNSDKKKIEEFISKGHTYKEVILISHSMGGLVLSSYMKDYQYNKTNTAKVDKVITLGAPFLGAPKILQVFETGEFLESKEFITWFANALVLKPLIKSVVARFPSTYEMLPPQQSIDSGWVEQPIQYLRTVLQKGWIFKKNVGEVKKLDYKQTKHNISIRNFYKNANVGLLESGQNFHNNLWINENGKKKFVLQSSKIEWHNIVGYGFKTVSKLVMHTDKNGNLVDNDPEDIGVNAGDGTVTLLSATLGNMSPDKLLNRTYFVKAGHLGLVKDEAVLSQIEKIVLDKGSPKGTEPVSNKITKKFPMTKDEVIKVIVACPVDTIVVDAKTGETLVEAFDVPKDKEENLITSIEKILDGNYDEVFDDIDKESREDTLLGMGESEDALEKAIKESKASEKELIKDLFEKLTPSEKQEIVDILKQLREDPQYYYSNDYNLDDDIEIITYGDKKYIYLDPNSSPENLNIIGNGVGFADISIEHVKLNDNGEEILLDSCYGEGLSVEEGKQIRVSLEPNNLYIKSENNTHDNGSTFVTDIPSTLTNSGLNISFDKGVGNTVGTDISKAEVVADKGTGKYSLNVDTKAPVIDVNKVFSLLLNNSDFTRLQITNGETLWIFDNDKLIKEQTKWNNFNSTVLVNEIKKAYSVPQNIANVLKDTGAKVVSFQKDGALPGKAKVNVKVGDELKGKAMYVYYLDANENDTKFKLLKDDLYVNNSGRVIFVIDHGSDFILIEKSKAEKVKADLEILKN